MKTIRNVLAVIGGFTVAIETVKVASLIKSLKDLYECEKKIKDLGDICKELAPKESESIVDFKIL